MTTRPYCDASKPGGATCRNRARWVVTYREAELPGQFRRLQKAYRCTIHSEALTAFPKGATQITVRGEWNTVFLGVRAPSTGEADTTSLAQEAAFDAELDGLIDRANRTPGR